jgi:hypothetical protein
MKDAVKVGSPSGAAVQVILCLRLLKVSVRDLTKCGTVTFRIQPLSIMKMAYPFAVFTRRKNVTSRSLARVQIECSQSLPH